MGEGTSNLDAAKNFNSSQAVPTNWHSECAVNKNAPFRKMVLCKLLLPHSAFPYMLRHLGRKAWVQISVLLFVSCVTLPIY